MRVSKLHRLLPFFFFLLSACAAAATGPKFAWRVRDMVSTPASAVNLHGPNRESVAILSTRSIKNVFLAHSSITKAAGIDGELLIVDGEVPNALVGLSNQRPLFAVTVGMMKLIGDDIDEFAALIGHETAHLTQGHMKAAASRRATLKGIATLIGVGLGIAGVPAGGVVADLGANLIDASYSRSQEREADEVGLGYMINNNFDPQGAIRLHEKLLKSSGGASLPFLSSHPSGEERIENLKAIIKSKQ
ncbi:MAG: M48 family metalloprotease [Deltaproteobacteria bacterium]|nr:M48 family metalloprotease [Deltaproteobacteria bacterium]